MNYDVVIDVVVITVATGRGSIVVHRSPFAGTTSATHVLLRVQSAVRRRPTIVVVVVVVDDKVFVVGSRGFLLFSVIRITVEPD